MVTTSNLGRELDKSDKSSNDCNYRSDIDGLRAVAVLSVLVFHASPRLLHGGFVGVDIFFVISGYLISSIIFRGLEQGRFSLLTFYSRRIKRIFPALILILMATLCVGYYDLSAAELLVLGKHVMAGSAFLSNFALWNEIGYFDQSSNIKPLLHLWSLGVEEQYYLIWPFILIVAWRKNFSIWKILAFVALSSFIANIYMVNSGDAKSAFFLPWTRFWELMVGSTLAWFEIQQQQVTSNKQQTCLCKLDVRLISRNLLNEIASWVGTGLLLFSIITIDEGQSFPGWQALFPTFGAALLIFAGKSASINRHILSHKWVVAIGLISYPLYLWHWPLIVFPRIDGCSVSLKAVLLVMAFVLAWMTYQFIEKPIRFGSTINIMKYTPVVLLLILFAVGGLGAATWNKNGYPERFPKYINQALSYADTMDLKSWRVGKCFLLVPSNNETQFDGSCVDNNFSHSDAVFLWGDSILASLYPGFSKIQTIKHFPLAQFTATNCPPFLNYDDLNNKHCRDINLYISSKINKLAPHTVVISAYWLKFYKDYDVNRLLGETVTFLRKSGVKRIVVIGPLPLWSPTLLQTTFNQYKLSQKYPLPEYTSLGLSKESWAVETRLRDRTIELGATYFSALDVLCKDDSCLSRVGSSYKDISSFDTMHLSVPGAEYLVNKFVENNILGR